MLNLRNRGGIGWSLVVVALAYVLALQAMLAAAISTQHAVAASSSNDFAVICFGLGAAPTSDDGQSPSRIQQSPCVICAIACAPGALPQVIAFVLPSAAVAPIAPLPQMVAIAPVRLKTPRLSQGPPLTI